MKPALEFRNLVELFQYSSQVYADDPAYVNEHYSLTYAELDRLASELAQFFLDQGLEVGDRVLVLLPNVIQFPIVVHALIYAGLIPVNCNPFYTAREISHILKDSQAKACVFLDVIGELIPKEFPLLLKLATGLADMAPLTSRSWSMKWTSLFRRPVEDTRPSDAISWTEAFVQTEDDQDALIVHHAKAEDLAMLSYTMGTTGVAKGAMLSHGNLLANLDQLQDAWLVQDGQGLRETGEVALATLPLYTSYAFSAHCLLAHSIGSYSVLVVDPRDKESIIKSLKRWPISFVVGVNNIYASLLASPAFEKLKLTSLRFAVSSGTPLQKAVADLWRQRTSTEICQVYGLAEASPGVSVCTPSYNKPGSAGRLLKGTSCRIVDPETGQSARHGEILLKGPQVFKGYWRAPATTEAQFIDGWFVTGDIGEIDDSGYLFLHERRAEVIHVAGFAVYPSEVERVINQHPGVVDCAVVGLPRADELGETVSAMVVRSDPNLSEASLTAYCRNQLAAYKVPKRIRFAEQLPLSPLGKAMRRQVRFRISDQFKTEV